MQRIALARLPTPLEPARRLTEAWGGPRIWIKRDDLIGFGLSGNKARKLEFHLGGAVEAETDTVITCGALQSNHCRATALAANRLGISVVLFLRTPDGGPPAEITGNHLLQRLAGAECRYITPDEWRERDRLMAEAAEDFEHPWVIPEGGSDALGLHGFVTAMSELQHQLEEAGIAQTVVWHAASSGGTTAGLVRGASDAAVEIVGSSGCSTRRTSGSAPCRAPPPGGSSTITSAADTGRPATRSWPFRSRRRDSPASSGIRPTPARPCTASTGRSSRRRCRRTPTSSSGTPAAGLPPSPTTGVAFCRRYKAADSGVYRVREDREGLVSPSRQPRIDDQERRMLRELCPSLRRFAAVVGPAEIEPDDLVQEALVRVLQRTARAELDAPGPYLRRSMYNLAANQRRSFMRRRRALSRLGADAPVMPEYPSDVADLLRLSPKARAALYLSAVEGRSFAEIAALLGCSEQSARKAASRGRNKLRLVLSEEERNATA